MTSTSTTKADRHPESLRRIFAAFLVITLIGLGISIELTRIHYATHTDENYRSVCAVSDEINCETVARSPYSVFLGAPVSAWGMLGYTVMAVFAAWGFSNRRLHPRWPYGVFPIFVLGAVGASAILAYISFTRIDSLCLFCMSLYLINTVLLGMTLYVSLRYRLSPIRAFVEDITALFRRPAVLFGVGLPICAAAAGLMFGITPYWQRVGWTDLPALSSGIDADGLHWIGAKKPILTIVEFSDYQCPYCRRAHRDIRLIAGKFPTEVRLVHRHFPLDNACNRNIPHSFHEFACKFSKAAVCAGDQGKFWAMNDALFSVQDTTKAANVNVEHLAVELGLDRSQFVACMDKPGEPREVERDIKEGERLQLAGTPTYFINGQSFEGGVSEQVIEKLLANIRKKHAEASAKKP